MNASPQRLGEHGGARRVVGRVDEHRRAPPHALRGGRASRRPRSAARTTSASRPPADAPSKASTAASAQRGVVRLVLAVQREEHVLVGRRPAAQGQQLAADRDLAGERPRTPGPRAAASHPPRRAPQEHLGGLGRLLGQDGDRAGLDDPGLLPGDRRDVVTEEALVVERDRRDHGDLGVDDVGRVPGAAHADLDDGHVDRRVGERRVRHADRAPRRRSAGLPGGVRRRRCRRTG